MNILITGATSGIGFEVVKRLSFYEHNIIIGAHTTSEIKTLNKKIENYSNISVIKMDITKNNDISIINNLKIDVLFCHAGVGYGGSILDIPIDTIKRNYEVNVFSTIKVIQLVSNQMLERGSGRIIIMSSLFGIVPMKFFGIYSSTKASLNSIAYSLYKEMKLLNKNIKVSLIQPGAYHTGFNQQMIENNYKYMSNSYFNVLKLTEKNLKIFSIIEKKKYNSIVKKIIDAILSDNPKFIYRAPFFQSFIINIYNFFLKLH
jgi:short-subunit dehydrogenase